MPESSKRRIFLRVSKFQQPVLYLFVFSALMVVISLTLSASYLYVDITNAVINSGAEVPTAKIWLLLSLMTLPLIFLVIIVWAYYVSNKSLGAFERILRELDEIVTKNEKRHIKARKGDKLAEELLAHINTLIDRVP